MRMSSMFCQNASFLLSLVTACGPNYRLFDWNDRNWLQSISDFNRCLGKTHPLCNHSKTSGANHGFFHRQMWKMHFNQCMRMGSNFKPNASFLHFVACGPKSGLFHRNSQNAGFAQPFLRHVAQTSDFFAERRKMDWNRSMRTSPIFSKNVCFVQPFYGM